MFRGGGNGCWLLGFCAVALGAGILIAAIFPVGALMFLVAFLLILAGWLPYILIFWPGSVPYDGFRQLNMFAGNQRFTNKHPWELSLIMGALMTIGNVISDNWGIFMVVGVLALIYAVCYATVCYKLKSWYAPMMVSK